MRIGNRKFDEVTVVDFEFGAPPGEQPDVICMVARDLETGRTTRLWADELRTMASPPYGIGPDSLVVGYYVSAEMGCHLALGWDLPQAVLDPFTEFRCITNGRRPPCGNGLVGALAFHGLGAIDAVEKDTMRSLALRGGPWSSEEQAALLTYCESDVDALARLLARMLSGIDGERALLRGRYMKAAARIEHCGVPIDVSSLLRLRHHWTSIQERLIERVDRNFGVYEGRSFRESRWESWLTRTGIPWPQLESGRLALDRETFRAMARLYPDVTPIHQLRTVLSELRLEDLAVGSDGRNRCILSAFSSKTGRNQPSSSRFIFGQPSSLRHLIKPSPGRGVAYIDYEQQENGIAAAVSGDPAMIAAYESGDPYLEFAKQAGAVPDDATKETHGDVRDVFKACALAVQYGMGAQSLGQRIGRSTAEARELLRAHHETYGRFWRWSDAVVDFAMMYGELHSVFGWKIHVTSQTNDRSLRNFPMQANGAEMLRLACSYLTEAGIRVCAPVHDAILIEADLDSLDDAVARAQDLMAKASRDVLGGFALRSDAKVVRYPDRYSEDRGADMWRTVQSLMDELEEEEGLDANVE